MTNDIFRTVRELLESNKCVLMGNAVNNEGELYDDSVANLTAILAMKGHYDRMYALLERLVYNYAHYAAATDTLVAEAGKLLQEIDG